MVLTSSLLPDSDTLRQLWLGASGWLYSSSCTCSNDVLSCYVLV